MTSIEDRYLNDPGSRDAIWIEARETNQLHDVSLHMSHFALENVHSVVNGLQEIGYEFL